MRDVELADELAELVGQLKHQLGRHHAAGRWAAPGGATPRAARDADATDVGSSAAHDIEITAAPEAIDDSIVELGRRSLAQIRAELGDCTRCKLHSTRKSIVFGVGDENAPLMFVGEAPGEQEDKRGEPFVGPAGELLDKMIEAMGWSRQSVFINNILCCRPPGNRNPQPDEVSACKPFLEARIGAIAPRIIVALGRPAANTLLGTDAPISTLRGKFHDRLGVKVMPTFHPSPARIGRAHV